MRRSPVARKEIDIDSLFIDETVLPRARRTSGEIITSKSELSEILQRRGIITPRDVLPKIIQGEGFSSKNSVNPSQKALFMSERGAEILIHLINTMIQEVWDSAKGK